MDSLIPQSPDGRNESGAFLKVTQSTPTASSSSAPTMSLSSDYPGTHMTHINFNRVAVLRAHNVADVGAFSSAVPGTFADVVSAADSCAVAGTFAVTFVVANGSTNLKIVTFTNGSTHAGSDSAADI